MRLNHPSIRLARLTTSENELQHGAKESGGRVFNSVASHHKLMMTTDLLELPLYGFHLMCFQECVGLELLSV